MPARQRETNLLVPCQREGRRHESVDVVTLLAPVQKRRTSELSIMVVFVTIHALRKLDFVEGILALGQMAFSAFQREVLSFQWVSRFLMRRHIEKRWFPPIHRVTRRAFAAIYFFREL